MSVAWFALRSLRLPDDITGASAGGVGGVSATPRSISPGPGGQQQQVAAGGRGTNGGATAFNLRASMTGAERRSGGGAGGEVGGMTRSLTTRKVSRGAM